MNRTRHEKHKALSPDVVRRVDLLWSDAVDRRRIGEALATYGVESYEQETDRVQLAILKLSEGTEEKALAMVAAAKQDYRDVLMWAEYPEQGSTPPPPLRILTKAERNHLEQVRRRDRKQYEAWLKKPGR
jgi:hypothetical protein